MADAIKRTDILRKQKKTLFCVERGDFDPPGNNARNLVYGMNVDKHSTTP